MKRFVVYTITALLFIGSFVMSAWYFLDWTQIGIAAMNFAHSRVSSLSYTDTAGVDGGFAVNNLTLSGMVNIRFGTVIIRPEILSSILTFSAVSRIDFRSCQLQFGRVMNLGRGTFILTYSGSTLQLEDIKTDGDISVDGSVSINLQTMRITQAGARLRVPEEMSSALSSMRNILPLVQEGGTWYLRR